MIKKFQSALKKFKKSHKVLGVIELGSVFDHGEKYLHSQLSGLKRATYQTMDRIVVILEKPDVYEFVNWPGKAITLLQYYVSLLDIPNFCVTVFSSNPKLNEELEAVRQSHSTEDHPISAIIVNARHYENLEPRRETMCILPWIHLYVGPDGNVLPCCMADHDLPLGNIRNHQIEEIINHQTTKTFRKNILSGKPSKECAACYYKEDAGLVSPRIKHNTYWSNYFNRVTENDDIEFNPVFLDIRLSNICNLKCRTCSGYFSSSIAQEEVSFLNNTEHKDSLLESSSKRSGLEDVFKYLPTVEKIYFAGGEPLIMSEHYKILEQLIEYGNTGLRLFYNTNFTNLKFKNKNVLEFWRKFSNVTVGASLDAYGPQAEYLRHGTIWADIEYNLQLLQKECPHVSFKITSTVSAVNIPSLIDLQRFWITSGRVTADQFELSLLLTPDHMSSQVLPYATKLHLINQIKQHCAWLSAKRGGELVSDWLRVISFMLAEDQSHLIPKLMRITKTTDQLRGESFIKIFPDFKELAHFCEK